MPKKILYIGNKLATKGATVTSIETLGGFLEEAGWEVITASAVRNQFLRLCDMLWTTWRTAKQVDFVLIDTYSTRNFIYAEWVAWLCRRLQARYIPILRGGDLPKRLQRNPSRVHRLMDGAYQIVAPSHYLYEAFKKAGFTRMLFIPNTIDIARYTFRERSVLAPKLLWVRSFARIYNPELALEVLSGLLAHYPHAELCMVGPDKDGSLERCRTLVEAQSLPVRFTGKLEKEEWIALAAEFDLFINTTNFDNTPVSVMEAMALGLPVVSTDVGGMPYLIDHQIDGTLVSKADKAAFIAAIKALIEDPRQAQQLSKAARRKVETFDWAVVKQQWMTLLNQ